MRSMQGAGFPGIGRRSGKGCAQAKRSDLMGIGSAQPDFGGPEEDDATVIARMVNRANCESEEQYGLASHQPRGICGDVLFRDRRGRSGTEPPGKGGGPPSRNPAPPNYSGPGDVTAGRPT